MDSLPSEAELQEQESPANGDKSFLLICQVCFLKSSIDEDIDEDKKGNTPSLHLNGNREFW